MISGKKALKWLGVCAACALAGTNLYLWNAQTMAGEVMPMPFGVGISVVLSGSMEPTLSVDDLVIVKAEEDVEVGDVVVYQDRTSLVIHRVVAMDGDTVIAQGDANNTPDAPLDRAQIKGTLVAAIPRVGGLVRILKQPVVAVALLVLACYWLTVSRRKDERTSREELMELKREIEKLKEETDQHSPQA